jgi:hypothetical protein
MVPVLRIQRRVRRLRRGGVVPGAVRPTARARISARTAAVKDKDRNTHSSALYHASRPARARKSTTYGCIAPGVVYVSRKSAMYVSCARRA